MTTGINLSNSYSNLSPTLPENDSSIIDLASALEVTFNLADQTSLGFAASQVLADSSLTITQKQEYVAALIKMSAGESALGRQPTAAETELLRTSLEELGFSDTWLEQGNELAAMKQTIGAAVESGRLDVDDIHGMLQTNSAFSAGRRELLTEINDGALLDQLATRLVQDARIVGFDADQAQYGALVLSSAADVANMAAEHGFSGGAHAVLDELFSHGRVLERGLVKDALSLDRMIHRGAPERTEFSSLSGLLDSVDINSAESRMISADRLFAALIRSEKDPGFGINTPGAASSALESLNSYMSDNFSRLATMDWESTMPGEFYEDLTRDSVRYLVLRDENTGRDVVLQSIVSEVYNMVDVMLDERLPPDTRKQAVSVFGEVMGSIDAAIQNYKQDALESTEEKIALIRIVSDKIISGLADMGAKSAGPFEGLVTDGVNSLNDIVWARVAERSEARAEQEANDITGAVKDLAYDIFEVVKDQPGLTIRTDLINEFRTNRHLAIND